MKSIVPKPSVLFTGKGWIWHFKPCFKTSNSSVINIAIDDLWIVSSYLNGNAMFLDKFLINFDVL